MQEWVSMRKITVIYYMNVTKQENDMIISTDTEKAFVYSQNLFMIGKKKAL